MIVNTQTLFCVTTILVLLVAVNCPHNDLKFYGSKFHENVSTQGYCSRYASLNVWWEQKCNKFVCLKTYFVGKLGIQHGVVAVDLFMA